MAPHRDKAALDSYAARRAIWEEVAARARLLHCPDHFTTPWRVVVIGETVDTLDLQIYGCCVKLGVLTGELVGAEPRLSGPR